MNEKFDLVVTFKGKSKKIKNCDAGEVKPALEIKFGISFKNHDLEYYDKDSEKWITIDNEDDFDEDLDVKTEMRIVERSTGFQPQQGIVNNDAPKSDSEAFDTMPSLSSHTGGGRVNIVTEYCGEVEVDAKNISRGKGSIIKGKIPYGLNLKSLQQLDTNNQTVPSKITQKTTYHKDVTMKADKYNSGTGHIASVTMEDGFEIPAFMQLLDKTKGTQDDIENITKYGGNLKVNATDYNSDDGDIVEFLEKEDHSDLYFPDFDGEKFNFDKLLKSAKKVKKDLYEREKNNPQRYSVSKWGKSQALLFNFLFENDKTYDRGGAKHDTKNLEKLLKFIGFQVTIVSGNATEDEMKQKICKFLNSNKVDEAPVVLLFIGSHGKQKGDVDMFWDANKKEVKTYEIVDLFATEKLKNKPKLFWFQFCRKQSQPKADGVNESFADWYMRQKPSSDSSLKDESYQDMFLGYAAMSDQKAYRVSTGSWFVMSICVVLIKRSHEEEYKEMFEKINEEVKSRNQEGFIQTCDSKNGLTKKLFFYPQ